MKLYKSLENELKILDKEEQLTMSAAMDALANAYAPYSSFKVGAALLLENGEIIQGSNQENVAYPSGTCAERSALFTYGSSGKKAKIKILAITALGKDGKRSETCSPCGGCRQVMVEYEKLQKKPYKVVFWFNGKLEVVHSSTNLLPFSFHF